MHNVLSVRELEEGGRPWWEGGSWQTCVRTAVVPDSVHMGELQKKVNQTNSGKKEYTSVTEGGAGAESAEEKSDDSGTCKIVAN